MNYEDRRRKSAEVFAVRKGFCNSHSTHAACRDWSLKFNQFEDKILPILDEAIGVTEYLATPELLNS